MTRVKVPGLDAEVLLPTPPEGGDAYSLYLTRLAKTCSFPEQRQKITELSRVGETLGPDVPDNRPTFGIIVSEPKHLHGDTNLAALIEQIKKHGGRPVLIPPRADLLLGDSRAEKVQGAREIVAHLDGLIGPGGDDVQPRIYHSRNRWAKQTNYPRDRFEADLALAGLSGEVFMLGICRSHQLWNGATGGKIVQDLREEGYSNVSHEQTERGLARNALYVLKDKAGQVTYEDRVVIRAKTRAARVFRGGHSFAVNSFHHQAVKEPGGPFELAGVVTDPETGRQTAEATEAWNAFTVQWHPENLPESRRSTSLFATVVRRAEIFRLLKLQRREGRPSVGSLLEAMEAHPSMRFDQSDRRWLREDLAARCLR